MEMPDDLSAIMQDMVRSRIRQNWPRVRAHECRKQQAAVLADGEWVVVRSSSGDNWIGRVLQIEGLPYNARQQDYFSALPCVCRSPGAQQLFDARADDGAQGLETPREGSRQGARSATARSFRLRDGAARLRAALLTPEARSAGGVGSSPPCGTLGGAGWLKPHGPRKVRAPAAPRPTLRPHRPA